MFFANKEKKTGNSRVLTEAEIKKKLYGDYETASSGVHAHSSTKSDLESPIPPKRDISIGSPAIRSPSFGATSRPESLSAKSLPPAANKTTQAAPKKAAETSGFQAQAISMGQTLLGLIAGLLWKLGSYFIQILDFVLRILDPRKPQARKLLYSITACVLVAVLFIGVFRLNAHRKKAMMGQLPVVAAPAITHSKSSAASAPVSTTESAAEKPVAQIQKEETQEKILKKLEGVTPAVSETKEPAVTEGKYVIQIATYALLDDANRLLQNLSQAGFTAFTKKQIRNSTGHAFYPVYLGRFESFPLAQQNLAKFRKASVARPFQDSFIRTLE